MPTLAENRKAFYDYTMLEKFDAGIVLSGQEVKAAKSGEVSLKGSFVIFRGGEGFLTNAHIGHYKKAAPDPSYNPVRDRKLLLGRREIESISRRKAEEGLAVVPTKMFTRKNLIKIEIVLARGKKKYDKRKAIAEAEAKHKIERAIKKTLR